MLEKRVYRALETLELIAQKRGGTRPRKYGPRGLRQKKRNQPKDGVGKKKIGRHSVKSKILAEKRHGKDRKSKDLARET